MGSKIVLIGAGSAQFGFATIGDLIQSETLKGSEIMLFDINAERLGTVSKTAEQFVSEHKHEFTISATTDRAEALQNAGFCVISIEIGDRFDLWEQDWRIPQQYGFHQVYGENGGPGGLFHSLRIVPAILDICSDINRICPQAFVFNYSNPMTRICQSVNTAYPHLRFYGLCHEIKSLTLALPKLLELPLEKIHFRAGGLNHFSALLEVSLTDTGENAYPTVLKRAPGLFQDAPGDGRRIRERVAKELGAAGQTEKEISSNLDRGKWHDRYLFREILETYQLLPITTDSHFGEYLQWAHHTVDHEGILDFYESYKMLCRHHAPQLVNRSSGERLIPIIEGILNDSGYEEWAANMQNNGLIKNLPDDIAVEVPATVDRTGMTGVDLGRIPTGFAGMLLGQVAVNQLTAEAVIGKSKSAALQALFADPVVDNVNAARRCFETMLELQKEYLGYLQ